jgi:hypothetical protein
MKPGRDFTYSVRPWRELRSSLMRFNKRVLAVAGALAAVSMMASAAGASAALYPTAILETETSNAQHFQQVATQSVNNETCRADVPVLVSQPEIDTRVTIKGEDSAATSVECADAMLSSTALIQATLYVQYRSTTGWVTVPETITPGSSRMVRGAGALPLVVDYVYPAGHVSQGKPHRACVDLHTPKDFLPLCSVPVLAAKSSDLAAS